MFNSVRTFIQWNLIISVFLSSFVPLVLSFCIQFHFLDRPIAWFDIFSTSTGLLASMVAASLTIGIYLYTRIKNVNPTTHPKLSKSAKILANREEEDYNNIEQRDPKAKNKYWALASCLRSLFLVAFVSTLSNYPLIQCSTALGTNVAFFLGILKWRFFDRKLKDVIIKVCEGLNAVIPSLFLIHAVYEYMGIRLSQEKKILIGWGIIGLVTAVMVLTLVYQVVEMWYILKRAASPLLNKIKAFLEYSIGKDIWKRKPKQSISSLPYQEPPKTTVGEETQRLRYNSNAQPQTQSRLDETSSHLDLTSGSLLKDLSSPPYNLPSTSRIELATNQNEIMSLKKSSQTDDIMSVRLKK